MAGRLPGYGSGDDDTTNDSAEDLVTYPDNKKIVGPLDRQWVSRTEAYELRDFVDAYLASRNYAVNDKNRDIVKRDVLAYPGHGPIARVDLVAYLDRKYQR